MSKQVIDIFTGTANPELASEVSGILGKKISEADVGYFSDGEIKVQIKGNVRGHDTFILQSTCAPSNKNLMDLNPNFYHEKKIPSKKKFLLTLNILCTIRRRFPNNLEGIVPNMLYSGQLV